MQTLREYIPTELDIIAYDIYCSQYEKNYTYSQAHNSFYYFILRRKSYLKYYKKANNKIRLNKLKQLSKCSYD